MAEASLVPEFGRHREVEHKFRVHTDFDLPSVEGAGPVASVVSSGTPDLATTYLDTPDLRLAREGVTLRYRVGGSGDGWTLKLPVDLAGGAREEITATGPAGEVPEALARLVTPWARFAPLTPIATLRTVRSEYLLRDAAGLALAELVDDRVTVLEHDREVARFREIEIEDRGGGAEVLDAVGDVLREAGAVAGEFVPKFVRAMGPRATASPEPPRPEPVGPKDTAAAAITRTLREYVRAFLAADPPLRLGADDAVHQVRVSCRRLRSALRTYAPLLDPDWAGELSAELSWLASELSDARDAEVMLERLLAGLDALEPGVAHERAVAIVRRGLEPRVERGTEHAKLVLASERYRFLADRLVEAAMFPRTLPGADEKARKVLPPLVAKAWKRLEKRVADASVPDAPDEAYHRVRIAAKHVRYAATALAPVFGADAAKLAKRAEGLQDLLGDVNDAVVAATYVRGLAGQRGSQPIGFALGVLYAGQLRAAERGRAAFPEAWADAGRATYRRWLEE